MRDLFRSEWRRRRNAMDELEKRGPGTGSLVTPAVPALVGALPVALDPSLPLALLRVIGRPATVLVLIRGLPTPNVPSLQLFQPVRVPSVGVSACALGHTLRKLVSLPPATLLAAGAAGGY